MDGWIKYPIKKKTTSDRTQDYHDICHHVPKLASPLQDCTMLSPLCIALKIIVIYVITLAGIPCAWNVAIVLELVNGPSKEKDRRRTDGPERAQGQTYVNSYEDEHHVVGLVEDKSHVNKTIRMSRTQHCRVSNQRYRAKKLLHQKFWPKNLWNLTTDLWF
jgi:hypothetical protein